jgi:hypothetical protein
MPCTKSLLRSAATENQYRLSRASCEVGVTLDRYVTKLKPQYVLVRTPKTKVRRNPLSSFGDATCGRMDATSS